MNILFRQILFALILTLITINFSYAQEIEMDINSIVAETQKMTRSGDKMKMVWWIPEEFWVANFSHEKTITASQRNQVLDALRPYIIIAAIDGKIGPFGGVTYTPKAEIDSTIRLIDKDRNNYRYLESDKLDPDVSNFLEMMKPIVKNMLGPMGENMHFFAFSAKGLTNENIAVAKEEGTFSIKLNGEEFKYRLPLGSVLAKKTCPLYNEQLNGAWKYCPWHGTKL